MTEQRESEHRMSEVRRVLLLSSTTGYQLRAFNDAAERRGIELVFATDRCHKLDDPWQDRAVAVRFHALDDSVYAILERHRRQPVNGVIAVGDSPVVLAARAAEAMGLPWHSVAGAMASTDKRHSRSALAVAGLPAPDFGAFPASVSARRRPISSLAFPVVLKPVGLSGSRGVIRANDQKEFEAAFDRICALLARPQIRSARAGLEDEILVERYIGGREFALEGVLTHGRLQVLAIFDKPDPLEGPFFEETIYTTPSSLDSEMQARLIDQVALATRTLGLSHGPIHAECRITPEGIIYVLEIAGRPMGGLCSSVLTLERTNAPVGVPVANSASIEEILLRHAVGESVEQWRREARGAAVMMIPIPARGMLKGVAGEEDARRVAGVTDIRITAKVGQLLERLPEAGSYLGFIFARGARAADAERAVREAHATLSFDVARELVVNRER